MKKLILKSIVIVFVLMAFSSCSKDDNEITLPIYEPTVYAVGHEEQSSSFLEAVYWENGVKTVLPNNGSGSEASDVFVVGSDVYIAGYTNSLSQIKIATIWKNGVSTLLGNGQSNSVGQSIFVDGNDVYVVGYKYNLVSGQNNPILWKNGIETNLLTSGYEFGRAKSVFVKNNNVYIAGHQYNSTTGKFAATLWLNNSPSFLSNTSEDALANDVFIDGSDVFVLGISDGLVKYWRNGVSTVISSAIYQDEGTSILVKDSDIYITGYRDNIATYWKNGNLMQFSMPANSYSIFNAISIYNEDIYVGGFLSEAPSFHRTANVFKNNTALTVDSESNYSEVLDIVVQ